MNLTCCCCDGDAGTWAQHWNRDTGFGICPRCLAAEACRETPERLALLYGKADENYGNLVVEYHSRLYKVLATTRNQARANAFLAATPNSAVLMVSERGEIVIAAASDLGEPVRPAV